MDNTKIEIEKEVELLIESGVVKENDGKKVSGILSARRCLTGVKFKPESGQLNSALGNLWRIIDENKGYKNTCVELNSNLAALANIKSCSEPLGDLNAKISSVAEILDNLDRRVKSLDSDVKSVEILYGDISSLIKRLQKIVL
jgi:hypothetical protein